MQRRAGKAVWVLPSIPPLSFYLPWACFWLFHPLGEGAEKFRTGFSLRTRLHHPISYRRFLLHDGHQTRIFIEPDLFDDP